MLNSFVDNGSGVLIATNTSQRNQHKTQKKPQEINSVLISWGF